MMSSHALKADAAPCSKRQATELEVMYRTEMNETPQICARVAMLSEKFVVGERLMIKGEMYA